jgi:hypothetical protein
MYAYTEATKEEVIQGDIHHFWDWCCHLYSSCSSMMQWYMIVLSISLESVYKISHIWVEVLIFMPFYLESCIWPDVIWQWIQQWVCIKFCANLGKSATETTTVIRQAFGEESMSRTWEVQTHRGPNKARQIKSKVKSMLITFLWHQRDCSQRISMGSPNSCFHILL